MRFGRVVLCTSLLIAVSSVCSYSQQPTSPSSGQTACPVQIVDINPTGSDSLSGGLAKGLFGGGNAHADDGRMFVLKVRNTSGKDILGMKFQAAYYDATEDLNAIPVEWNWTKTVKADSEQSFRWTNDWRDKSVVGWRITLTEVLFGDHSKWEPANGQSCHSDYWRSKKH